MGRQGQCRQVLATTPGHHAQKLLGKTTAVIGDERLLGQGYGTVNPESIQERNGRVYGWDLNQAEPWRYSNDGITPLGTTYKMKTYFTTVADLIKSLGPDNVRVIGGYDPNKEMYLLTFDYGPLLGNETIGFSEKTKGFLFFDFFPETYGREGTLTLYFKGGNLYKSNALAGLSNPSFDLGLQGWLQTAGTGNAPAGWVGQNNQAFWANSSTTSTGYLYQQFAVRSGTKYNVKLDSLLAGDGAVITEIGFGNLPLETGTKQIVKSLSHPGISFAPDFDVDMEVTADDNYDAVWYRAYRIGGVSDFLTVVLNSYDVLAGETGDNFETFLDQTTNYVSKVTFLVNENSDVEKTLDNIGISSNQPWAVTTIKTPSGQESSLTVDNFILKDGVHYARALRDINSPVGSFVGTDPLISGQQLSGQTFELTLTNSDNQKVLLDAVYIGYSPVAGHFISAQN